MHRLSVSKLKEKVFEWLLPGAVVALVQLVSIVVICAYYLDGKVPPTWVFLICVLFAFLPGGIVLFPISTKDIQHWSMSFLAIVALLTWLIYTQLLRLIISRSHKGRQSKVVFFSGWINNLRLAQAKGGRRVVTVLLLANSLVLLLLLLSHQTGALRNIGLAEFIIFLVVNDIVVLVAWAFIKRGINRT